MIQDYIDQGWRLVLIAPSSKSPSSPEWNKLENTIKTLDQIPDTHGIGLAHAYSGTMSLDIDNWKVKKDINDSDGDGFVGFIHNCVIDNYLNHHESPEDIELYFCGPPLMNVAVQKMGEDFGIPDENIRFDDFGG